MHHQNIAGILYSPTAANYGMSVNTISPSSLSANSPARQNLMVAAATSTQNAAAQQLIGGAISPSLFTISLSATTTSPSFNTLLPTMLSNNMQNQAHINHNPQQISTTIPSQPFNNMF